MSSRTRTDGKPELLNQLADFGRNGNYLDAIRASLRASEVPEALPSELELNIQLQYAIALQHAGFFVLAQDIYHRVAETAEAARRDAGRPKPDFESLIYNARVQEAVLLERLGRPSEALAILNAIGPSEVRVDAGLARASLPSWIDVTRLKSAFALNDLAAAQAIAQRCLDGDWNQVLWGRLGLAIIGLLETSSKGKTRRTSTREIEIVIDEMERLDEPGMPWLALLAGEQLRGLLPVFSRALLQRSDACASRLGKFFIVASSSFELYQLYRAGRRRAESEIYLKRALNAYARCYVLLAQPFRDRLFSAAAAAWGSAEAVNAIMQSAALVQDRSEVNFAKMCADQAKRRSAAGEPTESWQVFEDFVRDWAVTRYPGRLRHIEAGRESADALIVRRGRGIVFQAKHVREPKKHIPAQLYLRNIAETYRIDRVERYVLVVSTSDPRGWRESLWASHTTERVRNLVPDPAIGVDIVLEPELQTDVVLDAKLFDKYFRGVGS